MGRGEKGAPVEGMISAAAAVPASGTARPSRREGIAVVGHGLGGGGSVAGIARLQAQFLSEVYDVSVISDGLSQAMPGVSWRELRTQDFAWLHRLAHVPREWAAARRLARAVLAEHARRRLAGVLIHSHALAAALAPGLRRRNVASILVVHGDIRDRPPGTYDARVTGFYRWVTPRAYRAVDLVLAGSEAFGARIAPGLRRGAIVAVVPSPVDVAALGPVPVRRSGVVEGSARMGYVGRFATEKGVLQLASAARLLWRDGRQFTLTWVGDGPLRAELESELKGEIRDGRTQFLGWCDRSRMGELLAGFDLICVPSLSEVQGLIAVEAQLCGVPIVASRTGGLADAVRGGVDGELAEPGNEVDLAAALSRALEGVAEGRYRVPDSEWLSRYSIAAYSERLLELLARVIAEGRRP